MPNKNWTDLSTLQLGRYAEYYAKMEFASYGLDVYTSEVDDHGVDFVAKSSNNRFYEVQVKAVRKPQQVFMAKSKMPEDTLDNRLVCLLWFKDGNLPDFYVIPGTAWRKPNAALADYRYDKPGQKCQPEWAINVSERNRNLLEPYRVEIQLSTFK